MTDDPQCETQQMRNIDYSIPWWHALLKNWLLSYAFTPPVACS
jgi:hypothetical protein